MSKKIKYSVDDWSDTFTVTRKAKYRASSTESVDLIKIAERARYQQTNVKRDLNVVFIKQFQEVCLRKGLNSRILMGDVNQLVFGMSKKEFMDKYGVDEPFNDNVPVHFIALKNMLLSSVTGSLMACPQPVLNNAAAKLLISKMAKPLLKAVSQEALNERQEKLFASSTWAKLVCTPN